MSEIDFSVPVIYGVASTLKKLKELDEGLYKEARKQLYEDIKPMMAEIKSNIPTAGPMSINGTPMSGFQHSGKKSGWKRPVVIQRQIISRRKSGQHPLVRIKVKNANNGGAVSIADMAGRGSSGSTKQGQALIRNLSQKPSRFVWPAVMKKKASIEASLLKTIQRYSNEVNEEMLQIKEGSP
jgi:hypothetical protein